MSHWRTYDEHSLPEISGTYVVYIRHRAGPAYVGHSHNVRKRIREHRALPPWGLAGARNGIVVKVRAAQRVGERHMREARLIWRLKPKFNRLGK